MGIKHFTFSYVELGNGISIIDMKDFLSAIPQSASVTHFGSYPHKAQFYLEVNDPAYPPADPQQGPLSQGFYDFINQFRNPSVPVNGWNNPPVVINAINPGYTISLPAGYNLGANNITINGKIKTNPSNGNPYYFVSDDNDVPASTIPSARCDCGAASVGGGHSGWCSSN